jgi:hypothetical protein
MRSIYKENLELNETGIAIKNNLKRQIEPIVLEYVQSGVNPNELSQLLNDISCEVKKDGIDFLVNYFKEKKFNTDKLLIKNIETSEEKYATYVGMGKQNRRLWKYEEQWEPKVPHSVLDENGHLYWWLHIDMNIE